MTSIMYLNNEQSRHNGSGERPEQGRAQGAGPRSQAMAMQIVSQQRIGTSQSRKQRSPCQYVT
jgi:hypothetical protein